MKDSARASRFSFRNIAESQMKQELREVAMEKCDPQIKEFAMCGQEKGLWVVWSCQKQFKEINDCMRIHNGPEAWEVYKKKHAQEIERKARGEA